DDRRWQRRHATQVARDGVGLTALLGTEPRIGAGRIDERDDRLAELRGQLHQPQRLAISLGVRHAEVARDLLARVASLLMTHHDDRAAFEARESAADGGTVAEQTMAVQPGKASKRRLPPVARVR